MAQTILIEPNLELRKIFSLNLSTFVGTDVIVKETADEAISLLKVLPQVALIITTPDVGKENTAVKLHLFIKSQGLQTHLVVTGDCPIIKDEVNCITPPVTWEEVIRQAASHLGVTLQDAINKIKPDYLPVGLYYFYDIQKSPCDVYIRIKKGPSEYQFVKRIFANEHFDKHFIEKYAEQGLREFYIPRDYVQYFTNYVTNNLVQKLERDDLSLEERIMTTASGLDIVRENLSFIGLDDLSIDISNASIASMVLSVKNSPEIAPLLKFLFSNKISYAYQSSHLLALMCHYVLSKQPWYKDEHLHILSFAAFFGDITLKSTNQMQISCIKDLAESPLSDIEKEHVLHHPKDAIELMGSHPAVNDHIKNVILQSHGKLDGIGFEENPGEEIHPLAKVFIISDCFVKTLLNPSLPTSKKEILPLLLARFTYPSYQKIIKALEQKYT